MIPKRRTHARQTLLKVIVSIALLLPGVAAVADDYLAARERLVSAYEEQDYASMTAAARLALKARPDYPAGLYNLALSYALDAKPGLALDTLERLSELRLDFPVEDNPAFQALKGSPRWADYVDAMQAVRRPVGEAQVAFRLEDGAFIPEGIAIDGETLYLGSIRSGNIVRHTAETESLLPGGEAGSVFGMHLKDGALWFAAAATDHYAGKSDVAGSGIHRLPLAPGKKMASWPLPPAETDQTAGDFVFDGETLIVADQADGRLYRLDTGSGYEVLIDRGPLKSPQGLVLDDDGEVLYIADWVRGLFRLELGTGQPVRLAGDGAASLYGIDGLYRHGRWLIAVQNGIRPHRVTALKLADDGNRIVDSRILLMNHPDFDEPTLGTISNNRFYVVANSHWNRFADDFSLPEGLAGPVILELPLPGN